ncbi:MAG: hypothetical protein V4534_02565 [Myxococcota bacterium]
MKITIVLFYFISIITHAQGSAVVGRSNAVHWSIGASIASKHASGVRILEQAEQRALSFVDKILSWTKNLPHEEKLTRAKRISNLIFQIIEARSQVGNDNLIETLEDELMDLVEQEPGKTTPQESESKKGPSITILAQKKPSEIVPGIRMAGQGDLRPANGASSSTDSEGAGPTQGSSESQDGETDTESCDNRFRYAPPQFSFDASASTDTDSDAHDCAASASPRKSRRKTRLSALPTPERARQSTRPPLAAEPHTPTTPPAPAILWTPQGSRSCTPVKTVQIMPTAREKFLRFLSTASAIYGGAQLIRHLGNDPLIMREAHWMEANSGHFVSDDHGAERLRSWTEDPHVTASFPETASDLARIRHLNAEERIDHRVTFETSSNENVRLNRQGKILKNNDSIFVIGAGGSLFVGPEIPGHFHHSSFFGGGAIVGAGSLETDSQGFLTRISNDSGHYRPATINNLAVLESLQRQGVNLNSVIFEEVSNTSFYNPSYNAQLYLSKKGIMSDNDRI